MNENSSFSLLIRISCTNKGLLQNPAIESQTIKCRCNKNSTSCFWTKLRSKKTIQTENMKCLRNLSRDGPGTLQTHCSQKSKLCSNVLNSAGSSIKIVPSYLCENCSRIILEIKSEFQYFFRISYKILKLRLWKCTQWLENVHKLKNKM